MLALYRLRTPRNPSNRVSPGRRFYQTLTTRTSAGDRVHGSDEPRAHVERDLDTHFRPAPTERVRAEAPVNVAGVSELGG